MAFYHLLDRLFPRSFLAKLLAVAFAAAAMPCSLALAGWPVGAVAVAAAASLLAAGAGLSALLAPLRRAVLVLERGASAPWADDGAGAAGAEPGPGDLACRLLAGAEALLGAAESRVGDAERRAERDPLTGLLNRRGLDRALRNVPSGAVALLDIDHFKSVNDRFGHAEGDRVLCALAGILQQALRPGDLAARTGGEEFAVVLRGLGAEPARQVAERLRMAVEDRLAAGGAPLTVSIGVAPRVLRGTGWPEQFDRADAALYRAKAAGRNRVELCVPRPGQDPAEQDRRVDRPGDQRRGVVR